MRATAARRASAVSPRRAILAGAILAAGLAGLSSAQFCPNGFPQAALPLECGAGAVTFFSGVGSNGPVVAVIDFRDPADLLALLAQWG